MHDGRVVAGGVRAWLRGQKKHGRAHLRVPREARSMDSPRVLAYAQRVVQADRSVRRRGRMLARSQ
eukprot:2729457-Alexandrium_andersonii.AAC.1